ncbi:MAG: carboxymuconolactone decarboxylase family protein [Neomegalonema sp.]|nr:carboxymuconolactone decarboxylase family protein [Neomegalonema sp.]
MSLQDLRQQMPEYAKDTKLNLGKVLAEEGAEGLSVNQTYQIGLACAFATRSAAIIGAMKAETATKLSDAEVMAAKAAATIMAMNNVYYRFVHLVEDEAISKLPANLRMTVIGKPGVPKVDFELMSLAVSAINGCGMCMQAHVHELDQAGVSKVGIQSAVRIAAVITAAAQALAE